MLHLVPPPTYEGDYWPVEPGEIASRDGEIMLQPTQRGFVQLAKYGVVQVTPAQAERALRYGWSLSQVQLGDGELVCIER